MAAQPRPPRAAVRDAIRQTLADIDPGERVLVGLSGGPDSLALCAGAVRVGQERGWVVGAAVVDHGLQRGSAAVAATAARQALLVGCQEAFQISAPAAGSGSDGPEGNARAARRAALLACADDWGARVILLGHTRDDQAETVLIRLARGSGTRSLAGMSKVSDPFRRPLLDLPRDVVADAAREAAAGDPRLQPWTDPHNSDPRYLRSRIRAELIPLLVAVLGPGAILGLARSAELAGQDADALDDLAHRRYSDLGGPAAVLPAAVCGDPAAVRTRVILAHLVANGVPRSDLTLGHVQAVDRVVTGGSARARVALPGARTALLTDSGLLVRATVADAV